jgi:hypothetical protein
MIYKMLSFIMNPPKGGEMRNLQPNGKMQEMKERISINLCA